MISNERPSPHRHQPHHGQSSYQQPRPVVQEDTLKNDTMQVERKSFVLTLKENVRGRFLRITEDAKGKYSTIIIPSTGLEEFQRVLTEMVKTEKTLPTPKPSAPPEPDDSIGNR
ncbi:MAG: RNA-binding protein [Verrucomicrobiota bacterium]